MASTEDNSAMEEQPVRRTRSGRAGKSPVAAAPAAKKTKKKTILVEVEVSEEEEDTSTTDSKVDDIDINNSTEKSIENSLLEQEKHITDMLNENKEIESVNSSEAEINDNNKVANDGNSIRNEDVLNNIEQLDRGVINEKITDTVGDKSEGNEVVTKIVDDEESIQNVFSNENDVEEKSQVVELCMEKEINNELNETKKVEKSSITNDSENSVSEIEATEKKEEKMEEMEVDEKTETSEIAQINEKMEVDEKVEASSQDNTDKEDANPDTEVISEDELPTVQAVKVPETEEVSDDELPGPKLAELPADTEVVSEDELPSVKKETGVKRKLESTEYDPGSPTSESDISAAKRTAVAISVDTENVTEEVEKPTVEKEETPTKKVEKEKSKDSKSKLPELDKYWKAVNDDSADFTGWTYLLQYVDQVNDIEAAREAYDAFLSHYPYCYGYWRKYADYEKRKGNKKKCEEVFERGLKAIPLSVDLWLHFLNYTKSAYAENEDHIREQFERALTACGLEFRSDRLWDTYIKWETEGKRLQNVTAIYDRLLATPTQGYTTHFDNFQEHVSFHAPNKLLIVDEFLQIRKEVRQMLKHEETPAAENPDIPPGEDEIVDDAVKSDEETKALKERIVSIRRKIHKTTVSAVTARWNFEEGIKRPYFHVKPLERCQLKNWKEYLDFEIEQGDRQRIMVLFERCLIACALYEEFWLRYVKYLEDQKDESLQAKIREVYERACTVHHVGKPSLHLSWAMYEEANNNLTKASEILVNLEKSIPNLLQVAYRRINLERRRGDLEKSSQLYEYYINNSKSKLTASNMAIKYARFINKICHQFDKAIEILQNAVTKDPSNPRIYLQLIDTCLQKEGVDEKEILSIFDQFLEKENNDSEQKVMFAQRKLEFLEDFGSNINSVQEAYEDYQKYYRLNKEKKKKEEAKGEASAKKSKTESQPPLPNNTSGAYSGYGGYGGNANQSANNYSQYGGQQSGYGGQYGGQYPQGGDQYQYQNWQYSQPGYGGYNQWGNYGNYYQ